MRLALLLSIAVVGAATMEADDTSTPSIEGTYTLVSRDLPNGTKLTAPDVAGWLTFTKDHRFFDLYSTDSQGRRFSSSYVASYRLTPTQYTETSLYFMLNDEISGGGAVYDLSRHTGSAAVSLKDGRLELQLPLNGEPKLVFSGAGITASQEGSFVDHWEKLP